MGISRQRSGSSRSKLPLQFDRLFSVIRQDFAFLLLCLFFCVLWLAGGASREDVLAQAVVRAAAWAILIVASLFGKRPVLSELKPIVILFLLILALPLVQLIPLPPPMWQTLSGRKVFASAANALISQPWRPISLVPGATFNAAASLVVPATILLLVAQMRGIRNERLLKLLCAFVAASLLLALMQAIAGATRNPFINEGADQVAGPFANRNHFAVLMAIGCLSLPAWAFRPNSEPGWRIFVLLGLLPLSLLSILVGGSRAGLVLGVVAIGLGPALARSEIRYALRRYPRWAFMAAMGVFVALAVVAVFAAVVADRAISISRIFSADPAQDIRQSALPVIMDMIRAYFPFGLGLGGFDPLFRLHEPFALLRLTYFNHAHNDFLEIAADAGLPGIMLLFAALGWWIWASWQVWRPGSSAATTARLGSAILFVVFCASVVDYPARTPIMMAIVMIAGIWLAEGGQRHDRAALRKVDRHL
jgi:O-antigen ligase